MLPLSELPLNNPASTKIPACFYKIYKLKAVKSQIVNLHVKLHFIRTFRPIYEKHTAGVPIRSKAETFFDPSPTKMI